MECGTLTCVNYPDNSVGREQLQNTILVAPAQAPAKCIFDEVKNVVLYVSFNP